MSAQVHLDRGPANAIWNSDGVRLRNQREMNLAEPIGSHVNPVSGSSYYTYIHMANIVNSPLGLLSLQQDWSLGCGIPLHRYAHRDMARGFA
jgi:hypothetical protein